LLIIGFIASVSASSFNTEKEEKGKGKKSQRPTEQALPNEEEPVGGVSTKVTPRPVIAADSSESSFEKFNFIFYFLYKYKYENDVSFENGDMQLLEVK